MKDEEFDTNDFIAKLIGIPTEQYLNEGLQNSVSRFGDLKGETDTILDIGISLANYQQATALNSKLNDAFVFCFNQNLKSDYDRIFELGLQLAKAMHEFANDTANKVCNDEGKHLLRYLIACKKILENEDRESIIKHLVSNSLIYYSEEVGEYCLIGLHIASNGPEFDDDDDELYQTQLQAYIFDSDRFFNLLHKIPFNQLSAQYEIVDDHSPDGGEHFLQLECTEQDVLFVKENFTNVKGKAFTK